MTQPDITDPFGLDEYDDVIEELRRLYGDDFELLAGKHFARFLPCDVPFHVISRVFQGRHLLRPGKTLNRIIAGVIGRALNTHPKVKLFANAFLSNHLHMMLQGPTRDVVDFIAFIKREISRRWGAQPEIDWPGTMWHSYIATALPTEESQIVCLKYILSQGVKEGLVAKPQLWPGVHSAKQLLADTLLEGEWFDATAFAVARDRESRKAHPAPVRKASFYKAYTVHLSRIAPWETLTDDEHRARIRKMCNEIEEEGRIARGGKPPLGVKAIQRIPLTHRSELPPQPWLSRRRRMVCWAPPHAPETREFVSRFWEFQRAFRIASSSYLRGELTVPFPAEAFRPSMWPMAERNNAGPP